MKQAENENKMMPALVFEMKLWKLFKSKVRGLRNPSGYWKPGGAINLKNVPIPSLIAEDWVLIKNALCGICGSDMKEVTLNGAVDNPLRSFLSFPQIMGHEVVGEIAKAGKKVKNLKVGDRVAISPWFACLPRGITPACERCQEGDYTHCRNFQRGMLPTGMHLGVTKGFGGYAPFLTVHESQCFTIPEEVDYDMAVLADPFSVAFHSCLSLDPDPDSLILVFGLGIIGLLTVLSLKNIFHVKRIVAVGRYSFQKTMALKLGAEHVFMTSGAQLIEDIAQYTNALLYTPSKGLKWTMEGVDGIIDTIASATTLEIGLRIITTQGRIILTGVSTPERCENTPHYFKEIEVIGSNAFSIEEFQGETKHAFEFFLEFLKEKRISTGPLVTHKFPLEQYQDAFNILSDKKSSEAMKVVFDFQNI